MPITIEDVLALETLESKLRAILPEQYQDTYEELLPVPMGSAGLKYDADGRVAWDKIWATFCDLAMAGGPPHRGTLLEPGLSEDHRVAGEICRGIGLVTNLPAQPSAQPGWVQVECTSAGMAEWLVRAVVMENILARCSGTTLYLPAGPDFRIEKEIKNVITVTAKTCHYWVGHIPAEQQQSIEELFASTKKESPLLQPASVSDISMAVNAYRTVLEAIRETIRSKTGFPAFTGRYPGWIGVECPSVQGAVWMMRAIVVDNVLVRREGTVLFLPVNPVADPGGERVLRSFLHAHHLAGAKKLL